jgi:hypothetical protein
LDSKVESHALNDTLNSNPGEIAKFIENANRLSKVSSNGTDIIQIVDDEEKAFVEKYF